MNFPGLPPLTGSSMPPLPNMGINDTGDKNGSFPQPEGGQQVHPVNAGMGGDRRNGSFPLTESRGVINPPNSMSSAPIGHSSDR